MDMLPDPIDHITRTLLPEVEDRMRAATAHYGETHKVLGLSGQFADIWRKVGPLKRAMWDGEQLTREDPRTILMDLIGHCLLSIDMIDRGMHYRGEGIGAMAPRLAIPASRRPQEEWRPPTDDEHGVPF